MKKYVVKEVVTANFGTLIGWSTEVYDTREEAEQNCSKFGFIEEIEVQE